MSAILTTLPGGLLAISGGLAGIALGDRRERSRWLHDSQWQASTTLPGALQLLVRRMINVACLTGKEPVSQRGSGSLMGTSGSEPAAFPGPGPGARLLWWR